MGEVEKKIAAFLKLLNPGDYTEHFLRTSTTTATAEAGFSVLQQIGTWKSSSAAGGYVQNSDHNK